MIKIAPSILACDLSRVAEEVSAMERAGAVMIHLDVMDGLFVNNLTFGPPLIKCLRSAARLVFDAHLMITDPMKYLGDLAEAGCDHITFHIETDGDPAAIIRAIKSYGMTAGIALKPSTPAEAVFPFLDMLSMVLVMTVEPGFGGQKFIPEMTGKITEIRREADIRGLCLDIQVDGGIAAATAPVAVRAGANVLVAGSSLFGAADYGAALKKLLTAAR